MSIESITKYLAGKKETLFDIQRNVNEVMVTRRIILRDIRFYYRDFRAYVYMQDLDYHSSRPLNSEIELGPVSVPVAHQDELTQIRDKVIAKFPQIIDSMRNDKTNTILEEQESKHDSIERLKKAVVAASRKNNIKPGKVLIDKMKDFISCYGTSLIVPTVSFALSPEKRPYMSFKWDNISQNFIITFSPEEDETYIRGRAFIILNQTNSRDFIIPTVIFNHVREIAPVADALGVPIVKNLVHNISKKPLILDKMNTNTKTKRKGRSRK